MIPIFFSLVAAFAASRFPPLRSCGEAMFGATKALATIDRLDKLGAERGHARMIWPVQVVHFEDLEALRESAEVGQVHLRLEAVHAYLSMVVAEFHVSGEARAISLFLKDVALMHGRELELVEWATAAREEKDDLYTEDQFRKKLKTKAQADFKYSWDSDETSGGRRFWVMRIWPSTYFSSRFVYLKNHGQAFVRLKAANFVDAYQEWPGKPSWVEIDGEIYLFGNENLLWDLRAVRRADLDGAEIPLRLEERPELD